MNAPFPHIPVMLHEVMEALTPKDGGLYIDATFGRGGYTRALLNAAQTQVVAIDRDPDAIAAGQAMVAEFKPRLTLLQGPFGAMDVLLAGQHFSQVDGIALDLGVSSPQLDDAGRGFSFASDGPLDMRMSKSGPSAADIVNALDERELADILYTLGEERYSRRVAKSIVEERAKRRIMRTSELAEIVRRAVPRSNDGLDPATRSFQALRIYVNDEMGELSRALNAAMNLLAPGGRLAVVSFHSLEDRIVKDFLRRHSGKGASVSRHLPANDRQTQDPMLHLITNKPQTPTEEECAANPRARSAKLRVAERTDAPAGKEAI
ncbi:MAG: 16S rRNA (cytosine(1402)-N(4))-methyltransferase RsmH [Alphaproteobacteria bacterium]|nr:16S rRNA (cytosine(1402)-N(4))-methyltransferase RsmH [Alphaproteobacteria bacterium]